MINSNSSGSGTTRGYHHLIRIHIRLDIRTHYVVRKVDVPKL